MRKITAGLFQSADGVIQSPGGAAEDPSGGFDLGGWLVPHFDGDVGAFVGEMMGGDYELLLGRRTFDIMASHWPKVQGDPFADHLNRIGKHVLTSRPDVGGWQNSAALADIDAVADLKASEGPDLIIQGSHTLHGPLVARGLLDRFYLLTFPVLLGSGKRLLDVDGSASGLRLTDHRVSASGVVMAVYETAGAVTTGTVEA